MSDPKDVDPDSTLPMGVDAADFLSRLQKRTLKLVVQEGPQKGATFTVEGEQLAVGSAPDNAVVLTDGTVSRHHARIEHAAAGLVLRDLGSRNGTFLDGNRVNEAFLYPGCRVRFGSTTVTVHTAGDALTAPADVDHFGGLYGRTLPMRQLFALLARVAPTESTVVLTGETGTGKEVAARAIHEGSARAAGPFVVLDGSAVDRELVSAELFGHEVGAFTGAATARPGAFEQAKGGTLFIDEVGELPLDLQAKLLRALEAREVRRLGGTKTVKLDCRVIAATHRNLKLMVRQAAFREDLYYRLAQVVVTLPPLRDRREDIPLLVERFLAPRRAAWDAVAALSRMELRGNVRELKNLVDRARALAAGPEITAQHLEVSLAALDQASRPAIPLYQPPPEPPPASEKEAVVAPASLEDAERDVIENALKACGFHRERAAEKLGISLPTLRERIRRYGIAVPKRARGD